jgi:hypothetical protein
METNNKEQYEAPSATIVEVKSEGHVCLSDGVRAARDGYGDAVEEDWQ